MLKFLKNFYIINLQAEFYKVKTASIFLVYVFNFKIASKKSVNLITQGYYGKQGFTIFKS